MKQYVFRDKKTLQGLNAETVGIELERIRETHDGKLKPTDVVDEARPKDAVLHHVFNWNNAQAAERWRVHQARQVIRSVQVIESKNSDPSPQFIHVKSEPAQDGYYQTPEIISQNIDEFERAFSEALQKLKAAERAVAFLKSLVDGASNADSMAMIGLALNALHTANEAISKFKH